MMILWLALPVFCPVSSYNQPTERKKEERKIERKRKVREVVKNDTQRSIMMIYLEIEHDKK